jgi:SAM-dependent methyltransferase
VCHSKGPFPAHLEILLRCPGCGLVFADPKLSYEEISQLYGVEYFTGDEYADYLGDKIPIQRSFRHKVELLSRMAPTSRRLFEIGAAYGFFLELAQRRWEVAGIDVADEAARHAREVLNLDVRTGDFLTAEIPAGYYDVFCMWDTIEHLARPDLYVERAAELIPPGGHFAISTGDIDALVPRRQGRGWRLIHPPTHLFYFSRSTLTRLLERCGFRVTSIKAMGMHRSLRQTVYSLGVQKYPSLTPLYQRFARSPLGSLYFYLNLGDIMVVTAQRVASAEREALPAV